MYKKHNDACQLGLPGLVPATDFPQQTLGDRAQLRSRLIRDLPGSDQPLVRLQQHGPGVLSAPELLAVLLGTPDGLALAEDALVRFGGLLGLSRASAQELIALKGVGPARAAQLKAALALGQRLISETQQDERRQIRSPADAAALLLSEMQCLEQEHLRVLVLDTKNRILANTDVYVGNVNSIAIRAGEVYRLAVRLGAPAILVAHNHPSGDPTPSPEDVTVTRQLMEAGKVLDIECLDHLVLGLGRWVSLRERGLLP